MLYSCRISTDKRGAWSLCHSRASCQLRLYQNRLGVARFLVPFFSPNTTDERAAIHLARSANLPEGLYILPMFFSLFFNGRLSSPRSSDTNGAIFTKISGLVDRCKGLLNSLSFFDFSRDVAMATIQSRKISVFPRPIYFVAMPFGNGIG